MTYILHDKKVTVKPTLTLTCERSCKTTISGKRRIVFCSRHIIKDIQTKTCLSQQKKKKYIKIRTKNNIYIYIYIFLFFFFWWGFVSTLHTQRTYVFTPRHKISAGSIK